MPISIISTPNKNISGFDSECASTSQLRYEFEDVGFVWDSMSVANDSALLNTSEGDQTSVFVDQLKVLITGDSGGTRNYTVSSSSWDGTNTTVFFYDDVLILLDAPGTIRPLYTSHVLKIQLLGFDNQTDLYYIKDSNHKFIFDIGSVVENKLYNENKLYVDYRLFYNEVFNGVDQPGGYTPYTVATNTKRQILAKNGANLYEHIGQLAPLGKHLSLFENPVIWFDYLNKFYFLIQDETNLLRSQLNFYDINKGLLGSGGGNVDDSGRNITVEAITFDSISLGFIYYVGVSFGIDAAFTPITEELIYRIKHPCNNPVMIEWLTSNGIYDKWLFQIQQSVIEDAEQGIPYNQPITEDLETVSRTKNRYTEKNTQFMTLKTDQLTQDQVKGLHDIKRSNDVRVWTLSTADSSNPQPVGVRVSSGYQTTYTTGKNGYEYTVNIEFPDNFDFFQS